MIQIIYLAQLATIAAPVILATLGAAFLSARELLDNYLAKKRINY